MKIAEQVEKVGSRSTDGEKMSFLKSKVSIRRWLNTEILKR